MDLVIDAGNTYIKLGQFEQNRLVRVETVTETDAIPELLLAANPDHILLSSVRTIPPALMELLASKGTLVLNAETPLPIRIDYKSRATLGSDRIAAACGADALYPGQNTLIFDAGTCLTHGFTDASGTFRGGSISPGLDMRFKALHSFTAKLPLLTAVDSIPPLTGNSTDTSVYSGIINGMLFEMEGFIRQYQNKYPQLNVLLTGGNAAFFEKRLKQAIFVVAELNLTGLNRILKHNV